MYPSTKRCSVAELDLDVLEHKINEMSTNGIFIGRPLSRDESNALIQRLRQLERVRDYAKMAADGENPNFWRDELDAALAAVEEK